MKQSTTYTVKFLNDKENLWKKHFTFENLINDIISVRY